MDLKLEVSSTIEKWLKLKVAKELFTLQGKATILIIWTVLTIVAAFGCSQVVTEFRYTFFIKPGAYSYNFI